jgi:type II secretory pathway component PulF
MDFKYTALDKEGKRIQSFMKADSVAAVVNSLRTAGQKPLKIIPLNKVQNQSVVGKIFSDRKRVSSKELIIFTRQLGSILSAGMLLSDAIETIATDLENEYFADVLKTVLYHVRGGENFSSALSYHPSVFSSYYIAIIQSGEAVGRLGPTTVSLATYMEESEKMRLKFVGAIRYPIFLICFVFAIVSGIVLFLIPRFKTIFVGAGIKLPLLTRIVFAIS